MNAPIRDLDELTLAHLPVQVSALCDYPDLLDHPSTPSIFPSDAIARAKSLIGDIGSTGAYSHSMGNPAIRKRVAKFIEGESCFCLHLVLAAPTS